MKSFEEMYSELTQNFKEVEKKRKKSNKFVIDIMVCITLMVTLSVIGKIGVIQNELVLLAIYVAPSIMLWIILYRYMVHKIKKKESEKNEKSYLALYKEKIVEPIIKNILPTCKYSPFKGFSREEYNKMLHYEGYKEYTADDLIEGDIIGTNGNKMHIKFSDLSIRKGTEVSEFYFQGIIGSITIDKEVSGYLKITTNDHINKKKQILMDSNEFEKNFNVESANKILAMQILTSDIMLNIIDVWNKTNIKFEIVIRNKEINLCFLTGTMFATKLFGNSLGKETLKKYHNILEFIKNISIEIYDAIDEADV